MKVRSEFTYTLKMSIRKRSHKVSFPLLFLSRFWARKSSFTQLGIKTNSYQRVKTHTSTHDKFTTALNPTFNKLRVKKKRVKNIMFYLTRDAESGAQTEQTFSSPVNGKKNVRPKREFRVKEN